MARTRSNMSPGAQKALGFVFTFAGLVMLYFSWYNYDATNKFLNTAQSTSGVVVDLERRHSSSTSSSGSSTTYAPVVEFTAPESGQTITFTSNSSSNPPAYDEGDDVTVLYDPAEPEEARIDSFMSLWFLPLLLLVMGGIFTPVGIGIMRARGKQEAV